jgi:alkylation response protein AidB-like acyl-CoA dehydrogenase
VAYFAKYTYFFDIGSFRMTTLSNPSSSSFADSEILERARTIGEEVFRPYASETDQRNTPRTENMQALASAGLLGLGIPKTYGGLDASPQLQREVQEILASYCGVTTFTQAQHHGPCRMISNCPNERMKQALLPKLAAGAWMCGVSFAHLRRPGTPILRAIPVAGGYRLEGSAPWVTGWGLMNQFVYGAALPDGRFVYLWVPVQRETFAELFEGITPPDNDWGSVSVSEPIPLCAMNASATVVLTLEGLFVPQEHWMLESDRETMRRNDHNNILGATAMPMGCATGAVRLLCETAEKRGIPAIQRAAISFTNEAEDLKAHIKEWNGQQEAPQYAEEALRIRAWCIEFAMRSAHAAIAASSGAANLLSHPAQRFLREAMFYTIQAQTHEVMDATLARLERLGG